MSRMKRNYNNRKILQHIILNDQFDNNAKNDEDKVIFVTNFKNIIHI